MIFLIKPVNVENTLEICAPDFCVCDDLGCACDDLGCGCDGLGCGCDGFCVSD